MKYKLLKEIPNLYPSNSDSINNYYTNTNGVITYSGIYPENTVMFNRVSISDVDVHDINVSETADKIRFIIKMIGDDEPSYWTSQIFKDELLNALVENNPYVTKDTVTIIEIDNVAIRNWKQEQRIEGETDANITVTKTISSIPDILEHIQWLVTSRDDIRITSDFGEWVGFERITSDNSTNTTNSTETAKTTVEPPVITKPPIDRNGRFVEADILDERLIKQRL